MLTASKNMDILEKVMSTKATPTDMDCYTAALRRFSDKCFRVGQVRVWPCAHTHTHAHTIC